MIEQISTNSETERILYENIVKNRGKPLDYWEVTALLEVWGLRDIDAKINYGYENLFEMAKSLSRFIDDYEYEEVTPASQKTPPVIKRVVLNYFKGLAFALPMLIQIMFTFFIGFSIWSSLYLNNKTATAIAIGTFAAMVIVGGSAQAIGRKGLYYIKQNEFILASKITFQLYRIGLIKILLFGLLVIVLNFFFGFLPHAMFSNAIGFYFLLAIFFLTISILYMFEDYVSIVVIVFIGLLLVYIAFKIFKIELPTSQLLGMLLLDCGLVFYIIMRLRRMRNQNTAVEGDAMPKASIIFYTLAPYYIYGTLYFLFLILDRIIAWSISNEYLPYFIWFNVSYEVGLDWALISLILIMGLTEISIFEFMYRMNQEVVAKKYNEFKEFNNKIYNFWKKYMFFFFIFAVFAVFAAYGIVWYINRFYPSDYVAVFFEAPTPFIFIIGSISYIFLGNTLMNILFLFAISRYKPIIKAVIIAFSVDIILGFILSRLLGYEYAVIGLLCGSFVFWVIVFSYSWQVFKKLDYYYYSAY